MIRLALLLLISPSIFAKNLGVFGHSYPVKERSFLSLIQERLAKFGDDDKLQAIQERWVKQVENHAIRPRPSVVTKTQKTNFHYYTPAFTAQTTIRDSQGRVIVAKGAKVNALEKLPAYRPQWVFINEDDKEQVRFAKHYLQDKPLAKLILTGGDVKRAEDFFDRPIYFDQEGRITKKLAITQVPATIKRVNNSLLITHVAIKGDDHEI